MAKIVDYQFYSLVITVMNWKISYCLIADICDPDWSYFNGFCYYTSETCTNWTTALNKCRQENSVLVDINNNEENVFLQHRHNGEKSWLGLNDISTEGSFTWVDRGAGNFTAWAKNQPNNFREEDCVHALGVEHNYKWNDVKCSDCHQYTCKKGRLIKSETGEVWLIDTRDCLPQDIIRRFQGEISKLRNTTLSVTSVIVLLTLEGILDTLSYNY